MILKKFKRIGQIAKPYYTQNNEQVLDLALGKLRAKIESEIGGEKPYDLYRMIADQAKRIDVLEALIKKLDPTCVLEPSLDVGDATDVYKKVKERMDGISKIIGSLKG
jgi:hypothetical protein